MADFNAYPALDIRLPQMVPGPDLGNILEQANKIQAGRNENSLFPLKQQALQTDNAMNQLILGEAQQAQKYNNINRQLKGIDAQFRSGDIKGAEQAWNAVMSSSDFPEGKQWGEISENKLAAAQRAYGQQELTATNRVRAGTAAAQQQQSGGNAFDGAGAGGGAGYSPNQLDAIGGMNPQQTQQGPVANYNEASDEMEKIGNSKDPAGVWNKELRDNPHFATVVGGKEFSWSRFDALKDAIAARRDATAGLSLNAAQGIPNPRSPLKLEDGNAYNLFDYVHPLVAESPQSKEKTRSDKAEEGLKAAEIAVRKAEGAKQNWGQAATYTKGEDGNLYPVYHNPATNEETVGKYPIDGGRYETKSKAGMTDAQREDAAQAIYYNDAKITDFEKTESGSINSRVQELKKSGNTAFGITGSKEIDISSPGYATKLVPGAGGLTQSSIDNDALIFASEGRYPQGLGIGSGGPTGAQKAAIQNRANEMFAGTDPEARKAKATALMRGMSDQVKYAMTTERGLRNFENTFQQLTDKYKGKINNYDMPMANYINNAKQYQLGEKDINDFRAGLSEVSAEYSVLKSRGGQLTDADKKTAADILSGNLSMKSMQAIKDEMSELGTIIVKGAFDEANSGAKQIGGTRGGAAIAPIGKTIAPGTALPGGFTFKGSK